MGPQHSRYRDGLEDRIYDIIQIHAAISLFVVFKQSSRTAARDVYINRHESPEMLRGINAYMFGSGCSTLVAW
ncbi:hypothetical protein CY34DRAFT_801825 [Suillus luteus UH-Slu-Lm8-n1]|uniref:Uncharacterized protein n=1 Tax=Suillus luteus UH-Slu-Lm8-n1 TaxID=930992 RepID=A0A0D0BGG6_9AGAM|nr:hypothetical protein CY34DRAFT_801825 [Suillus luteus UH-Slu-Lm8-n1]